MASETILGLEGGMNSDDSVSAVPSGQNGISLFEAGDYRYALNLRVGNTSLNNTGSGENIPSTFPISNYYVWNGSAWVSGSAQAGTNTALNKFEDRNEGKVYWAVYNSNGHHAILMFNKTERKIYELLQWDGLNFALTNFVSMTKINKYLIFTDGNPDDGTGNPPRCIDVTSIYTLRATMGNNFSEFHISLAKWAPLQPPIITMGSVDDGIFLRTGVYQFSYRYIYTGGFKSTWSPFSVFVSNQLLAEANINPIPLTGDPVKLVVNAPGYFSDFITLFNNSNIQFYDFVTYIEFGYRTSESQGWNLFSRVPISSSSHPTSVTFDNSGALSSIAETDIGQYYDSVPLLSRSVEAIDNRPMLGNNLDDLAPMTDFDVTDIQVYSHQISADTWYFNAISGDALFDLQANKFPIQRMSFKDYGIYKLGILFQAKDGRTGLVQTLDKWTYTIPATADSYPIPVESFHGLGFKIGAGIKPPSWAASYQIVRTNCLNMDLFVKAVVNDFIFLQNDNTVNDAVSTTTAIQDVISGYYDNYSSGSGATYSLSARILTLIRKNVTTIDSSKCTLIYIDIKNWFLDSKIDGSTSYPSNNVYYNWQPGDRVRFWASTNSDYSGGPYVAYDQEIIEFTGTALIISKPDKLVHMGNRSQVGGTGNPYNILFNVDVYRPKKYDPKNNFLFYTMGEWYPVINPGTPSRAFSKTDFTWINNASVAKSTVNGYDYYNNVPIISGDVWMVTKQFYYYWQRVYPLQVGYYTDGNPFITIENYPIFPQMTPDKANAAGTWEHNTGRPLTGYQYLPVQYEKSTQIRFGGKFLEDSIFIGINNFQDDNQKIYPSEYGKIRAMVNTSNTQVKDVGQILMVICEEETMDVYVNRATLQQLGGSTQVTLSDQVLGSYNTLLGSYGTLNPESVSKKNSRVLYWNAKRGMWIRRSTDGLTPISNVKMQNWFKDLSKLVIDTYSTSTPAKVISVFDPYYEEWITYLTHSSLPSTFRGYASYKCASFDEGDKRWKSIYDYAPELFAALENETYSIIGTVVHIHFAGTDYGSFYGVKKNVMWQPVANTGLRQTKIWRALNEHATDKWSIVGTGDYVSNGGTIQQTTISLDDLEDKEGTFWSDLRRDENTVNTTNPIIEGAPMRGRALTLLLTLDPSVTWYSFINWLVVTFDLSEKTVKK